MTGVFESTIEIDFTHLNNNNNGFYFFLEILMNPDIVLNALHRSDLIFAFTTLYDLSTLIPFTEMRTVDESQLREN